ncbi:MAG TPA: hypothetical protein VFQ50_08410, partial [Flavobacterium sp.]|nr:hypothetical protein [Flavobacterium sp.]
MKKALLFFWLLIAASSASGQTITWDGSASNLWNNPANWDLNTLPTSAHDVLIPTGSTVNLNVGATVNSIWIQGTTTFSINGSLGFSNPSTFDGGANINWVSGAISTGSTLANYGIINLLSTNNKQVVGGGMINNFGTINVPDSGDLYLTDATLNNQVSGIIDMQADAGNLSWSSGGAHILNNLGLIKRTSSAGTATIECQLNNSGTISVESGTLQFTTYTMMLDSGIYNVAAGTTLHWSGPQSLSGMLTGVVDGQILWTGTVSVATTQNADLNFSGSGTVNWSNGSLAGGGSLSNYSPIQVSTTTNKTIIGATTLNNHDVISIVDSGDIYITDGVINNHVAGTINLTAAAGNLSWSSGGTHTLNNYGIIRKLGDTGLNAIDCQMNNFGTIEVLAGNLGLTYGGINLNGGVYNISANSFLSISALTNMTGQLSGTIAGEILWTSTVNVPSSEVATFAFTGVGSGNVNWQNGVLSGGGVLVNNFTMRLSSTANKQIIGLTTLQNLALIYIQTSGDLYITDGIVNNMLTGIIDMRADAGDLSWSSGGSHLLNNYGLIKRTTTSGVATIECELHNFGTLSVQNGTMQLQGLPK